MIGFTLADIAVESQARDAVEQAAQGLGPLDLLINNAGTSHPGYFLEMDDKIFRETMETNYFGPLNMTRAVVPDMIRRGKGHIVFVSSAAAYLALFGYSSYAPTKCAVRGLSDVLRYELKPLGIRVTIVMPPDTDTPSLAREKKIRPRELDIISGSGTVYPPEAVARDILSGVERNRYIVITGWDTNLFYWLTNLARPAAVPGDRHYGGGRRPQSRRRGQRPRSRIIGIASPGGGPLSKKRGAGMDIFEKCGNFYGRQGRQGFRVLPILHSDGRAMRGPRRSSRGAG